MLQQHTHTHTHTGIHTYTAAVGHYVAHYASFVEAPLDTHTSWAVGMGRGWAAVGARLMVAEPQQACRSFKMTATASPMGQAQSSCGQVCVQTYGSHCTNASRMAFALGLSLPDLVFMLERN